MAPAGAKQPKFSKSAASSNGNLIHATENYHRVVEIVQPGVLGTITKCRCWMAAAPAQLQGEKLHQFQGALRSLMVLPPSRT